MSAMMLSLKCARVMAGLTQKVAAAKIGVTRGTVCNWERGKTCPTVEQALKLSKVYRVDLDNIKFF